MKKKILVSMTFFIFSMVFAEMAERYFYKRENHLAFSERNKKFVMKPSSQFSQPNNLLEPYFGYSTRIGSWDAQSDREIGPYIKNGQLDANDFKFGINNFGFLNPEDYPYIRKTKDDYVVGIFGGSVAHWFSLYERKNLIQKLQANPKLAHKRIIICNFAAGGYKQPQQLMILSYFLSIGIDLDMVINIDGINEIQWPHENWKRDIELSYPAYSTYRSATDIADRSMNPAWADYMVALKNLRVKLGRCQFIINTTSSALRYHIARIRYKKLLYQLNMLTVDQPRKNNELNETFQLAGAPKIKTNEDYLTRALKIWVQSSLLMDSLCRANGIRYFHFLQPNQYFSKHKFSDEEKKIALQKQNEFTVRITHDYPCLERESKKLTAKGVNFISGIKIFDRTTDAVYSDDVCHYNLRGNQILSDFVGQSVNSRL